MSSNTGKLVRMNRLFDEFGVCLIFAGCHQMTSKEVYPGQADVVKACDLAMRGGVTAINIGKGFIKRVVPVLRPDVSVLTYLPLYPAFSRVNPYETVISSTVEEAALNGADGVVLPVDFYAETAGTAMKNVADLVRECDKYGLVFVVEAEYPTFYETNDDNVKKYGSNYLKFAGRICAEMGVDVISTNYTNDPDSFADIVDHVKLPVLINGGTKVDEKGFLQMVDTVKRAGSCGCLVGRNISEAEDPAAMSRAIGDIFRHGVSGEKAYSDYLAALKK